MDEKPIKQHVSYNLFKNQPSKKNMLRLSITFIINSYETSQHEGDRGKSYNISFSSSFVKGKQNQKYTREVSSSNGEK